MDAAQFERLKARLAKELTAEQCLELEGVVREVAAQRLNEVAVARRAQALAAERRCPYCGHAKVVKDGHDKDRQRFRCQKASGGCGRGFNSLTGTPFARMRKPEKWAAFARQMERFRSLDDIVDSGIGIARLTAWRWRHRFLRVQADLQAAKVGGVVEADETFFRTSFKGSRGWQRGVGPEKRPPRYRGSSALKRGISAEQIPVVTALDHAGGIVEKVLRDRSEIVPALDGRVARESVVCSDGLRAYVDVAVKHGCEHRRVRTPKPNQAAKAKGGKPRNKGRLGLGHVNAHHERMKTFVNRQLRGVSTRYLHLYLGWLRAIRRTGFKPEDLIAQALSQTK